MWRLASAARCSTDEKRLRAPRTAVKIKAPTSKSRSTSRTQKRTPALWSQGVLSSSAGCHQWKAVAITGYLILHTRAQYFHGAQYAEQAAASSADFIDGSDENQLRSVAIIAALGLSSMQRAAPDFDTNKLRAFIAEYVGVEAELVKDEAHFSDDLGLDWLDQLELMVLIEDQFVGVEIAEAKIEIVGDLIRHIESTNKAQSAVQNSGLAFRRSAA